MKTTCKPRRLLLALLTAAVWIPSATAIAQSAPPRIKYDNQCITIDGKDMVIFSGAFHYFRCPKELWADRFAKFKAAGFNTIETYAAWNWHEQQPPAGPVDYSKLDMTDLRDFLAMAVDQFHLNVILRPGPYICAEWDGGGYPQWLLNKRPADYKPREWYRSDDPTYLAWCRHWYTAVAKVAAPFQITHRPVGAAGVILWQIENEYDYSDQPLRAKKNQLVYLAHTTRDLGIDVPLTTCVTNNAAFGKDPYLHENVVQSANTYPGYNVRGMMNDLNSIRDQTDKFRMISELQGGWFAQVGGKLSEAQGYDQTHLNHVTMFAWEHGFTVTNYYMGFGGTNFGDWAAQGLTTTYDYDAPIREWGGRTARYYAAAALGEFIRDHGAQLARSVPETAGADSKAGGSESMRKAPDGSRFIFVRRDTQGKDDQATTSEVNGIQIHYTLGSFGAKVLYLPSGATSESEGVWYPKDQTRDAEQAKPAAIEITTCKTMVDPGPTQWQPFDPKLTETQAGIFNRQFVIYRAMVPATHGNDPVSLLATVAGKDWFAAVVDGKTTTAVDGKIAIPNSGHPQPITILYENAGRPNFGNDLEQPSGLLNAKVVQSHGSSQPLEGWKEKHVDGKFNPQWVGAIDDQDWAPANINVEDGDLSPGKSAVYRCRVKLSAEQMSQGLILKLGRIDDEGTVYVNGKKAGEAHDWEHAQSFDVTALLQPGENLIAVHVINREGAGGLSKGASLEPIGKSLPVQWEMSQALAGVVGKWADTGFDDANWSATPLPAVETAASAKLMVWQRLKFELADPKARATPWRITLNAHGNGFVYLNGHQLGRWWQAGPQHDFYLPECWLNFGAGQTNVVTLELRPTADQPLQTVTTATVQPY